MRISDHALATMRGASGAKFAPFDVYEPPSGVLPAGTTANDVALACDFDPGDYYGAYGQNSIWQEGLAFPGFAYLAQLTQRPEYRMISETFAREMTRKWIKISATGDDDKSDRVTELKEALDRFKIADHFRKVAEHDGFYGRAHLFVDTGNNESSELATPLVVDKRKIKKGSIVGFRTVEPLWTYPSAYNTRSPLAPDFYKPTAWYVMGQNVHRSRLLTFVGREMPDYLKPNYAFAGLSMSQMAKPYVDNWLRTRQSVSDITHNFSVPVLATDMGQILQGGGSESLANRAEVFNVMRDNQGLMTLNKETEEFTIASTPLGTLDALQAQAQEQIASVSGIPLVKLLGTTPSGLNASSDGEIRVFYDRVHAYQEHLFDTNLRTVIDIVELHLWGEIDPAITFAYEPLWQLDDTAKAANWKTGVDSDVELINAGVISPEESRTRLVNDESSPYQGLDPNDLPEPPESETDPTLLSDPSHGEEDDSEKTGD
jgi:phage-related protein (TIGR01555 family)